MSESFHHQLSRLSRLVRSAAAALPVKKEMHDELRDAVAAQSRGYFLPDEDERLCEVFVRYLSARAALWEAVEEIQPLLDFQPDEEDDWEAYLKVFLIGFTAATMLVRSAGFIIDLAGDRPVVRKRLDEAEPRYGLPKKSFTSVYKNLSSTRRMWRFHESLRFYEVHRDDVLLLESDPVVGDLVSLLREEEELLQYRKRDYLKRKMAYRLHSFKRRHVSGYKKVMFHLLKLSGSAVADLRQPFVKPAGLGKRVTHEVIGEMHPHLRAGDVFITRHDDALSNLFLPGFWPHAALYIGTDQERAALGLRQNADQLGDYHFLEAKKDGVLLRPIHETLHVDAFMILRPRLNDQHRLEVLKRALTHEGKLYDFIFDFRKADRLACTEVIYRSFHGVGELQFELRKHHGRPCISAEDLIEQALGSGQFAKWADYGVSSDKLRRFN